MTDLTPFAAWLRHEDRHLREDVIGELAAQLRGDPRDPNPEHLPALLAYLISCNASPELLHAALVAGALYVAEDHPVFVAAVAEYAELWAADDPDHAVQLSPAELLAELSDTPGLWDEIGYDAADPDAADYVARALCDLAPWLYYVYDTAVTVEPDRITLYYEPGLSTQAVRRYGGAN